jgi:hypothetical protein
MSTTSKLLAIAVISAASVGLSKSSAAARESARHMCTGSCTADPGCTVGSVSCTDNPDGSTTVNCSFHCAAVLGGGARPPPHDRPSPLALPGGPYAVRMGFTR